MSRLLAPDGAVRQVEVHGQRLASRDGAYSVEHPSTIRALKREGFTIAPPAGPALSRGFVCTSCGFHAHFATCGRCGAACTRQET